MSDVTVGLEPDVFKKLSEAAREVGLSVEDFAGLVVANYVYENYDD